RIEVALNHLLGFARFLALIVKQSRLKERMLDWGGVAQRGVVEQRRGGERQPQQAGAAGRPMCPVQRQGSGPARGAGHDNDVQVPYSLVAWPCLRRAVQPSQTTLDMRPLRQILSGEATLIDLLDRRRRELMLLDQVHKILPLALAAQTGVADASPPELV